MSTLEKIAFYQDIRNEIPNQQLAKDLAANEDVLGIQELVENLDNNNKNVRSDCLKVLYEIGYLKPFLIQNHAQAFLKLLNCKENRMIWGAFIALATIAQLRPEEIWIEIDKLVAEFEHGSVITVVWGTKLFASLAATREDYAVRLFPILLETLETCIPRDLPTHAENMLPAITKDNQTVVLSIIRSRETELSPAQLSRCKKAKKNIQAITR